MYVISNPTSTHTSDHTCKRLYCYCETNKEIHKWVVKFFHCCSTGPEIEEVEYVRLDIRLMPDNFYFCYLLSSRLPRYLLTHLSFAKLFPKHHSKASA
jgi:hypothetical protein